MRFLSAILLALILAAVIPGLAFAQEAEAPADTVEVETEPTDLERAQESLDTVTAELMVENLERLAARHLVLCITLRDPGLTAAAEQAPISAAALSRAVVAGDLVREREVVLRRLRRLGIQCIEAPAEHVSTELINRYLEIKRRELV